MPLGIFILGIGFLMGSGILGDTISLIAFILGFLAVCFFSIFRQGNRLPLFYGLNFGIGMVIGVLSFVAEEGSAGSGIVFAYMGLGTVGSIAVGSLAARKKARAVEASATSSTQRSETPMLRGIICPYCLGSDGFGSKEDDDGRYFACLSCSRRIPPEYVRSARIPREVISAVGFRGHGKTVYFAALFHTMNSLASFWPGFYTFAIDEKSLDIVRQNSKLLKAGELPAATPMNFPIPTIVRFSNIPSLGDRFFLFYDTGGEAYARQSALIQYASFVRRSRAVIFILSLDDLEHDDQKMHELLSTYVQGLTELDGNTKNQHLIVVLSKGDRLKKRLEEREYIWQYLEEGRLDKLGNEKLDNYVNGMKRISRGLRDFVMDDLGEAQFLNFAGDRFKSVEFSIVSALGAEPTGNRLQAEITPKRIIDPILWVVYKSKGIFQKGYI